VAADLPRDWINQTSHHYTLHSLPNDVPFTQNKNSIHLKYESSTYKVQTGLLNGEGKLSILRADVNSTHGWRSRYYGHKEPAISLLLETRQPTVRFWTFFGFEKDSVAVDKDVFRINSRDISVSSLYG
jgi:hypothetical protein